MIIQRANGQIFLAIRKRRQNLKLQIEPELEGRHRSIVFNKEWVRRASDFIRKVPGVEKRSDHTYSALPLVEHPLAAAHENDFSHGKVPKPLESIEALRLITEALADRGN